MRDCMEVLKKNSLFKGVEEKSLKQMLERETIKLVSYNKNTIIAQENECCQRLGLIVEGEISVQKISLNGALIKIQSYKENENFGAALLYNHEHQYPFTLIAAINTTILYITIEQVDFLMESSVCFCKNYINFLSGRVRLFNRKIHILSHKYVRERLILFYAGEARKVGKTEFETEYSKTEISDLIGVARPSVSRELKNMQQEGLLEIEGRRVKLIRKELFFLQG